MNILRFFEEFPDEQSCRSHFKDQREKEGVICKKCSHDEHYWLKGKEQWQCKKCTFRTTLRSGTMMQSSKLPFRMWYLTLALMTMSKKGMSALEMKRQIGHKRYEPIWYMMHKIRKAMGQRDDLYQLSGALELDEAYISIADKHVDKPKRGKGSETKQNVAVVAESTPLEDLEPHKTTRHCRYFKMKVLGDHKAQSILEIVETNITDSSIVFSDKSSSYVDIGDYVETHIQEKSSKETTKTTLQWVHITISNAKRWLLGIHHMIKGKYLQSYLNEFCYKLNRRYFGNGLFNRAVIALAKSYG